MGLTVFKVLLSICIQGHSTNGTEQIIRWLKNLTGPLIHKGPFNIFTLITQDFQWLGI